jgi:ATP-dependent DNA helicase RecG
VNIITCIKVIIPDHDHNAAINILNRAVGTTDKSYEIHEPVEVRVYPARIEILSYPGPLPPLNKDNLMDENISSRRYRNRIIGDFLKELHLTEGRNTGFRKIRKALEYNGSPKPVFKTDDERSYFLTVLRIHPEAQVEAQVELTGTQIDILSGCASGPMSKREIAEMLGHLTVSGNIKRAMTELMGNGLLGYTIPDKPRSKLQRYRTTEKGIEFLRGNIE